jgi:hypothetical protein
MEEMFLQAIAALFIRCEGGICFSLYVGDGRALAPSKGVELGLLRFSRQGVDESLEMPCAVYDTVLKIPLSIMDYNTFLPKRAKGSDEHILGRRPRSRRSGLLHG